MNVNYLILLPVILPLLGGLLIYVIKPLKNNRVLRNTWVTLITLLVLGFVVLLMTQGDSEVTLFHLTREIPIYFRIDSLGRLFALLTAGMWFVTSVFQAEYLKHEKDEARYQLFFLLSLGALLSICFSGNLVTMYLFYEMMTLLTFPLVLHSMSKQSIKAAFQYLLYSFGGAFLALIGIFYLSRFVTSFRFIPGGGLNASLTAGHEGAILVLVFFMILGFGSKAGLIPLHGWLPVAHPVAPAPASALLSANVTKMGVLAIIRVIYYIIGTDFLRGTWVQYAFMAITLLTILCGSMLAYKEEVLKKRLAYSTISQVSYILFGISLLNVTALNGALLHVIFHSIVKNGLFFVSGVIIYKTGKKNVSELKGIGKEQPITMWCFTLLSITLTGLPPTSAFISKWYLAQGALTADGLKYSSLGPIILLISALLTAGYLITISMKAFFPGTKDTTTVLKKTEPNGTMLVPLCLLTTLSLFFGMFPAPLIHAVTKISTTLFP